MKVDRRTVIAGAAARLAAAPGVLAAQRGRSRKRTFMLVHGGGHGGWCWKRVAEPLRAAGHNVYAPTLTGLADRVHLLTPAVDLDTHIADIVNLLEWEELSDVILVGHSYGGMVITGVADRALGRIGHMVYLDAIHPKNGASLWRRPAPVPAGGTPPARGGGGQAPTLVNGVEMVSLPSEQLVRGALGVNEPADFAWVMAKLTGHPAASFYQPVKLQNEAAVHKLPTTDIWRSTVLANLRKNGIENATWAQNVWEINSTSHNLMITEPKKTTDMFLKIAAM